MTTQHDADDAFCPGCASLSCDEHCQWCGLDTGICACGCGGEDDDGGGCPYCGAADDCDCFREEGEETWGTAVCNGACVPMCDWCLVSHACPDECGGGEDCPYRAMDDERRLRDASREVR